MSTLAQRKFLRLVFLAALVFTAHARAASMTIKVAHAQSITEPAHIAWELFKKIVEEKSNGDIEVSIFPAAQLGDDREITEAVQLGNIDCATPSSPAVAPFAPEFYVLDTFFLFDSIDHVYKVLDGPAGKALDDAIASKNFKVIGYWDTGFRHITNSKRPIRKPADLAGIKIRVMENPLHMAAWKALGANPTPMAYSEVFTALQQGTIDGQENPWIQIQRSKLYEVQKYISKTGHIYTSRPAIMTRETYDALTDAQREIIDYAALEATKLEREEFNKQIDEREKLVAESGLSEIIDLTEAEKDEFRKILKTIEPMVRVEAGAEFTDMFMKAVRDAR